MTCHELTELLVEYYDGSLDPEIQEVMDRHREICPPCEGFLRTYQATIRLAEGAFRQTLPDTAREGLESQVLAALAALETG